MGKYEVTRDQFCLNGQAAFNDALGQIGADGGGYLDILDPGIYDLTSPLLTPANCVVTVGPGVYLRRYAGTYLIRNDSAGCTNYSAPGNIHVRGEGVLDVNAQDMTSTDGAGGITFVQCENVSVTGVTIRNVRNWHAIEYQAVRGGKITNVTAADFTSSGGGWWDAEAFQLDLNKEDWAACDNITVQGCTSKGGYGKLVGSHASRNGKPMTNIRVLGNHAEGCNSYAVGGENWRYVTVTGNTFISCNGLIQMRIPALDDGGAPFTSGGKGFAITGNVAIGSGNKQKSSAVVDAAVNFVSESTVKHYNIAVSGNTFQGTNPIGMRTKNAAYYIGAGDVSSYSGYGTALVNE